MSMFRFEAWPTEFRIINQLFGVNRLFYAQFNLPGHEGLDIRADLGSRIFCVAPGRVTRVHTNPDNDNYGIHVRMEHAGGYRTIYAHLQQAHVNVGDVLPAGVLLGLAGSTGNSTGPHLHLTLKKAGAGHAGFPNNIVDPTPYLLPLLGWQEPAGPFTDGWAFSDAILAFDKLAQANNGGVSLRMAPARNAGRVAVIPEGTLMIVTGARSGEYTPVRVPNAAIGLTAPPPPPAPPPPETVATVDGWGFAASLAVTGNQAVVGDFGINLRATPDRNGVNIGLVRAGSTVSVRGPVRGDYLPIRVRRSDFTGAVNLPEAPPVMPPGSVSPPAETVLGWGATAFLAAMGPQATVTAEMGLNLRAGPRSEAPVMGVIKGFATVAIAGVARGDFTPIVAHKQDILNLVSPIPAVVPPEPLPDNVPSPPPPQPIHDTTPGWAFTAEISVTGEEAIAGPFGINLRAAPRRDAPKKGVVPAGASMIVTGPPQGEYTPVRVDDHVMHFAPGFGPEPMVPEPVPAQPEAVPAQPEPVPLADPDPPLIGQARLGLHASADPGDLREEEFALFAALRPGIIKVLSGHSGPTIGRLATAHPTATWIVRAFLSFQGGRVVTPEQFFEDTVSDVERALGHLDGRDVVVELHNEPNLTDEGLGSSWSDGAALAVWWLSLLDCYRQRLPNQRFIYPGLSPGPNAQDGARRRLDHVAFLEASRAAAAAADGLGVHIYWARDFAMERALAVLDDFISRFPTTPIWVTEASNNKGGVSPLQKGRQYLRFWAELKKRPTVKGVTYFVASASNMAEFGEEVWLGRGIAEVVGMR
jgi:hypothetical protein